VNSYCGPVYIYIYIYIPYIYIYSIVYLYHNLYQKYLLFIFSFKSVYIYGADICVYDLRVKFEICEYSIHVVFIFTKNPKSVSISKF